jgi:hypothetical protein
MDGWVMPNRAAFPAFAAKRFTYDTDVYTGSNASCETRDSNADLFPHQRLVAQFLSPTTPFRGLLLFHGLGSGKTATAVTTATAFAAQGFTIIVLLPASLESNFEDEVRRFGGSAFRPERFAWRFSPVPNKEVDAAAAQHALPARIVRVNRGVYVQDASGVPYADLDPAARGALDRQIKESVRVKFGFFHYNGLSAGVTNRLLHTLETRKCFVIIDEVHNFISNAGNNPSSLVARLHHALVHAPEHRILALSGTPFINYPREIAYLVNLIKGVDRTVSYDILILNPTARPDKSTVLAALHDVAGVDMVDRVDFGSRRVTVRIARGHVKDTSALDRAVAAALSPLGIAVDVLSARRRDLPPLPQDEEVFFNTFVDEERLALKNKDVMMRRMLGFSSYFQYRDVKLYPRIARDETVTCTMSEHQYKRYRDARLMEIGREEAAARRAARDMLDSSPSSYKMFSRMACNFAFPASINRPFPSTLRDIKAAAGDAEPASRHTTRPTDQRSAVVPAQTGGAVRRQDTEAYHAAVAKAMASLVGDSDRYLRRELQQHSCKFAEAVKRIMASPGSALVYSQFLTVEGLAVFAEVLRAHGYSELTVQLDAKSGPSLWVDDPTKPLFCRYTGGGSGEENRILRDVFNSNATGLPRRIRDDIARIAGARGSPATDDFNLRGELLRVFMITQSGAEGITLANVRQVHILEPYWNDIRLSQVVGRAVRTCSHYRLPPAERDVSVYRYVARIPREFARLDKKMKQKDGGLSADEMVRAVATRKTRVMNEILDMIRMTAFDCAAHEPIHRRGSRQSTSSGHACYSFAEGDATSPAYDLDLSLDQLRNAERKASNRLAPTGWARIVVDGTAFAVPRAASGSARELFDLQMFERGVLVRRGRLVPAIRAGKKGFAFVPA